jgi:ABC-type multidrug transport system fused ATPase/permease subunit
MAFLETLSCIIMHCIYFEESNSTTVITLLSALLGDMIRVKGDANIRGKIAYVPQQAWMQNATLKNNILFGTEYKQGLYEKVGLSFISMIQSMSS